ncbi:MAG: hypothetical protein V3V20_01635 [Algisphaera sp.]
MARMNRRNLIDLSECTCYHVISRCTRQLHLLGTDSASRAERKGLLLQQLERLASFTAVGIAGWSVMDNHLHLLLKVDTDAARSWSDREVARRWLKLHPARDGYRNRIEVEEGHVDVLVDTPDATFIPELRERLTSISHFMKELKQEMTQQINKLEDTIGSLWAGRFKSKRVTSESQLLTTLAYIDLNPFAAGVCKKPEAGEHTSLAARLHGVEEEETPTVQVKTISTKKTKNVRRSAKQTTFPREKKGWWMTVGGGQPGMANRRRSLMPDTTLTFGRYLKLLDAVSRLLRKGKKHMRGDSQTITDRIGVSPTSVAGTLKSWFEEGLPWEGRRRVGMA